VHDVVNTELCEKTSWHLAGSKWPGEVTSCSNLVLVPNVAEAKPATAGDLVGDLLCRTTGLNHNTDFFQKGSIRLECVHDAVDTIPMDLQVVRYFVHLLLDKTFRRTNYDIELGVEDRVSPGDYNSSAIVGSAGSLKLERVFTLWLRLPSRSRYTPMVVGDLFIGGIR
jgi:hypothetical protein